MLASALRRHRRANDDPSILEPIELATNVV